MLWPKNIKYLAFSGGGQRGLAYAGCLKALSALGVRLKTLRGVSGTSIGAVFALALALRFSVAEILEQVLTVDVSTLLNLNIKQLYYEYGVR